MDDDPIMDEYTRSMLNDHMPKHRRLLIEGAMCEIKDLAERINARTDIGIEEKRELARKETEAILQKYGLRRAF